MNYGQAIREQVVTARKRRGWSQAQLAERAGLSQSAVSRLETTTRGIDVDEYVRIALVLGFNAGDLLPNSAGLISGDVKPLVDSLKRLEPAVRTRTLRVVEEIVGIQNDLQTRPTAAVSGNVVAFPQQRTAPEWTPEFPVKPEEFVASGDGDYPLFLHGWEIEDLRGAAGNEPASTENPMGTILNMKEVREGRVRSVKVQGDSMRPTFEEGWLIAVDVGLRNPKDEDPVAVYRPNGNGGGIILGRWEKRGEKIRLLKDNDTFSPVELRKEDMLVGTIIDIIKKPVPPPPRRKR